MRSLTVVGTGIRSVSHLTLEAIEHIRGAEKLFYLSADVLTERWLRKQNASAQSLHDCYEDGQDRSAAYERMALRIAEACGSAARVCAAFYGHPGVLCTPGHSAIRLARARGVKAVMLPGISTVDCLFADLGVDPGRGGCQEFDATDFLTKRLRFDPRVPLILWQIGLIGQYAHAAQGWSSAPICVLSQYLRESYASDHTVAVYRAAEYTTSDAAVAWVTLKDLPGAQIGARNTLYVPPASTVGRDAEMAHRIAAALSADTA